MKIVGDCNNLSAVMLQRFRDKYPVMKPGEHMKFRLLNIKPDPDNPGRIKMPFSKKVPAKDRIFDKGDQTYKDIAYVESVGFKGEVTLGSINFFKQNAGMIYCRGGVAAEQDLCDYLLLSNYRDNNGDRNKNLKPTFTLVDAKATAKAEKEARDHRFQVMKIAKEMDNDKVKMMCLSLGLDSTDMDIMRGELEKLAEDDAAGFLRAWNNPMKDRKAILREAVNKGIIRWVPADSKFVYGKSDKNIAVIPRGSGLDEIDELATWTMKDDSTEAQYKEIVRQVLGGKKQKE